MPDELPSSDIYEEHLKENKDPKLASSLPVDFFPDFGSHNLSVVPPETPIQPPEPSSRKRAPGSPPMEESHAVKKSRIIDDDRMKTTGFSIQDELIIAGETSKVTHLLSDYDSEEEGEYDCQSSNSDNEAKSKNINKSVKSSNEMDAESLAELMADSCSKAVVDTVLSSPEQGAAAIIQTIKDAVQLAMGPLVMQVNFLNSQIRNMDEKIQKVIDFNHSNASQKPMIPQPSASNLSIPPFTPRSPAYLPSPRNQVLPKPARVPHKSYSESLMMNKKPSPSTTNGDNATNVGNAKITLQPPRSSNMNTHIETNPAYDLARRCQGFHPITSLDISRHEEHLTDIVDKEEKFQEAGKMCIREYMYIEMKMSRRICKDIRIKSVFFPAAGAITATLFAEFHDEGEVLLIKKHSRHLKVIDGFHYKLVAYVPKSLQDRYKEVEKQAFMIRTTKPFMKTRIWMGSQDIELRVKGKDDDRNWATIKPEILLNLPVQAPKRVRKALDLLERRTPLTPAFPASSHISKETNKFFNLTDFSDE